MTGKALHSDVDVFMRAGGAAVHSKLVDTNALLWAVSCWVRGGGWRVGGGGWGGTGSGPRYGR